VLAPLLIPSIDLLAGSLPTLASALAPAIDSALAGGDAAASVDPSWIDRISDVATQLSHFGPVAILFLLLLPLGEELILIPAGVMVGHGSLPFALTWFCAWVGVVVSDSLWFFMARYYGTPLLHKRWFKRVAHPRRLLQAKHQFERRGAWVIVSARFLPGSRTAAIIISGMLHMPVWKYLLTESVMAIFATLFQISVGMFIAHNIGSEDSAKRIMTVVGVMVAILVGGAASRWILAHRRSGGPAPRARAAWLRRFRVPRRLAEVARKAASSIHPESAAGSGPAAALSAPPASTPGRIGQATATPPPSSSVGSPKAPLSPPHAS